MNKLILTTLMLALVNITYSHDSKKIANDEQKNTAVKKAKLNEAPYTPQGLSFDLI